MMAEIRPFEVTIEDFFIQVRFIDCDSAVCEKGED